MLKNILKLDGAQKLTKNEQKTINAGTMVWDGYCLCEDGTGYWAYGNNSCKRGCFSSNQ